MPIDTRIRPVRRPGSSGAGEALRELIWIPARSIARLTMELLMLPLNSKRTKEAVVLISSTV